jgi:hypothetical protein
MEEYMSDESPATKGDILSLRAFLKEEIGGLAQRIALLEQRMDGFELRFKEGLHEIEVKLTKRMDDFAASLEEQIRDSQTEVLKAMLTTQESNLAPLQGD